MAAATPDIMSLFRQEETERRIAFSASFYEERKTYPEISTENFL